MPKHAATIAFCLLLSLSLWWAFHAACGLGYVQWDDNVLIEDNALLRLPWSEAWRAMFGGFYSGDYLPLTLVSYWLETHLAGGPDPQLQHLVNLALHALNTALLALCLVQMPELRGWAVLICAVFALHPVQVESVVWISERKGLLAASFYLGATCCALQAFNRKNQQKLGAAAYLLLFSCALLSKANGLLLPLWLLAYQGRSSPKKALQLHLPALAIAVAIAYVRTAAYASSVPNLGAAAMSFAHLRQLPASIATACGFYARTLLAPSELSIIYPPFSFGGAWTRDLALGSLIGLLAVVTCCLRSLRPAALALLFALLMLAPVLQIVPRLSFVNDRYLYLPIIGCTAALLLAFAPLSLTSSPKLKFLPALAAMVLSLTCASASAERAEVWRSNLALWTDTARKYPGSSLALNNLGQAYLAAGQRGDAIAALQQSIALAPAAADNSALNNLAMLYSDRGYPSTFDLNAAMALLRRGIALAPRPEEAFILRYNLGLALLQHAETPEGLAALQALAADLHLSANQHYLFLEHQLNELLTKLSTPQPAATR